MEYCDGRYFINIFNINQCHSHILLFSEELLIAWVYLVLFDTFQGWTLLFQHLLLISFKNDITQLCFSETIK